MKERPILFSGPMVRAILEGRKTQTRRLDGLKAVNEHPDDWDFKYFEKVKGLVAVFINRRNGEEIGCKIRYVPGDRLWVRETWAHIEDYTGSDPGPEALIAKCFYRADYSEYDNLHDDITKWRPSIFMPRWASRITLEIMDVRVERVHSISNQDAWQEGVNYPYILPVMPPTPPMVSPSPVGLFKTLWDSINTKRGFGWDKNPWVWVVEFKQVTGKI